MGFWDSVSEGISGIISGVTDFFVSNNTSPSCSKCINCKQRILTLPNERQIRLFTCLRKGSSDKFKDLPAVDPPNDSNSFVLYTKKYMELMQQDLFERLGDAYEQVENTMNPLRKENYYPITTFKDLKIDSLNISDCHSFKPYLDYSSSMINNPGLIETSLKESSFEELSNEEKEYLLDEKNFY